MSPLETGCWQLDDVDLGEYLQLYQSKRVAFIIAPVADAPRPNYTCGIGGFVARRFLGGEDSSLPG